jgi:PAS domain S-box-containing protein
MENEQARLCRQVADLQFENSKLRRELEAAQQSCSMSALRQTEEKFRLAFQTSPDSINFNRLADGVCLDINEGFTKLTGYTRADAIGKSSVDLGVWCSPEERARMVKNLMSAGYVENFEARFRRKSGEVGVGLMSARVLVMDGEEVILSITRDITERKKIDEELHENLLFLGQIEKIACIGGWKTNIHTNDLKWTEGVHRIIEAPPDYRPGLEEGLGFYDPEFVPMIKAALTRALEDGAPFAIQAKVITTTGKRLWAEVRGLQQVVEGGKTSIVGTLQDITERKQSEDALRRIKNFNENIVNSMTDGIALTDAQGTVSYVNPSLEVELGYGKGELIGQSWLVFVSPDSLHIASAADQVRATGRRERYELKLMRRDGSPLWVIVSGIPLLDSISKQFVGMMGVFTDITERKKLDETLRKREEQYRAIFENAVEGFFQSTAEGRFVRVNRALARMCGYDSPEEMIAAVTDIGEQHYESKEEREQFIALLNAHGVVENFEHKACRRDGGTFWVSVSARAVKDADGRILYYEGSHVDIDERKRAEMRIVDATEQYRSLFDTSTNAIMIRDRSGTITMANRAAVNLLAAEREEDLLGRTYLEFVHPEDRPLSAARIKRIFEIAADPDSVTKQDAATIRPREHRMVTLRGDTIDVESTGVAFHYKGDFHIQGIFRDITDRRRAEDKLRETEKKYRELAESLPQVIFEIDAQGNLVYLNQKGYDLFGYTPADLAGGFNVIDGFVPEDRESAARNIAFSLQGHRQGKNEYTVMRKDGTTIPVEIHAERVLHENTAIGIRGVLLDLTPNRRAQEERERLEAQLQQAQKMEAIGALAGGIAHDFNNILSAIIGYTELAMLNEGAEHCQAELKQALLASNRARDLIKQILAFSRQTDEERMPIRVGLVTKECVKFLRATIPSTIAIKTRIDEKSGTVLANSVELHQIIMNLCTNALHAIGDRGGTLEIAVEETQIDEAQKQDTIGLDVGPYVRVSVKDTGGGIPPEILGKIFDPYFTTKAKGVGTGLGLAVVHGIVRKSGGAIQVESVPDHGTTFHILLPRVDQPSAQQVEQIGVPVGGSERILFVDDETMLAGIGQQMLKRLGYDVVARTSPIEALELFKAKPEHFDIVVTDQTMPGMTGDALAREMMRIRPGLPVIICTGYSQSIDERKAFEMGIRGFVMKPILINRIAVAIRKALAGKPSQNSSQT